MTPGESVVLRSEAPDYGGVVTFGGGADGRSDRFDVLELRAAATLRTAGSVPDALAPVPRIDPATASEHRLFSLDGTQINQHKMDMGRIDVVATVDTVEVWDVRNDMAFPHSFHVHDVQFQVVSIGGKAPPPELAGWKDTVYLRPNTDYRLVMRFADYADPEHPYMYHCHLLRHEDAGMMGQFLVVAPGQQPKMEETTDDHH
jgi:bilirubin oxidase